MRRVILWSVALLGGSLLLPNPLQARSPRSTSHEEPNELNGPSFKVGGLVFTLPAKWVSEPTDAPTRAGQWHIAPTPAIGPEGAQLVVIFFGPGVGGGAKENVDAWSGTVLTPDGHPATPAVRKHATAGFPITEATLMGTYNQFVPMPGLPPTVHAGYGLIGAVVENPQGNIYWRLTGPAPLVASLAPLFAKVLDSVKPQDKAP